MHSLQVLEKMKIVIGYPPTTSEKGLALLSQNRQFQWFSNATRIFPVILASAATMLKASGYNVTWKDAVAEDISIDDFHAFLQREQPDYFIFESKTPVIKQHWQLINDLKSRFPCLRIIILGDHVTNLPDETMESCNVDFVVCGGDYDFMLNDLFDALDHGQPVPDGILYRKDGDIVGTSKFKLNHDLDEAPFIDRDLTKWRIYQKEYNLQGRPFMYTMSGRDCWYGKCTFCAWTTLFPKFRVRSVNNVLDEVGMLIERYGTREIFDDSGTLMTGDWLKDLCEGLVQRGYTRKTKYSCNMRFGALKLEDFAMMKKAGFRLLKFGLESANQGTLDRLNKKIRVEDIKQGCVWAKQAGLTVHLTMMVGFPWETREEALRTFNLAKYLMQKGYADLLQATTVVPYPGTPMYKEALKNNLFLFDPKSYERFDMSEPVLKTKMDAADVRIICSRIYTIFLSPQYILARLRNLRSLDDIKFTLRGVKPVLGHLKDFGWKKKTAN